MRRVTEPFAISWHRCGACAEASRKTPDGYRESANRRNESSKACGESAGVPAEGAHGFHIAPEGSLKSCDVFGGTVEGCLILLVGCLALRHGSAIEVEGYPNSGRTPKITNEREFVLIRSGIGEAALNKVLPSAS